MNLENLKIQLIDTSNVTEVLRILQQVYEQYGVITVTLEGKPVLNVNNIDAIATITYAQEKLKNIMRETKKDN